MANGPFKMKGSPMARNFGAPFKNDKKSIQDNTRTTKTKEVTITPERYGYDKEKDDFLGDFFNVETDKQAEEKVIAANRAKRKADSKKTAKEYNAKKQAEIAKKEAESLEKSRKKGKGKNYETKANLKKKIKIIKDNS